MAFGRLLENGDEFFVRRRQPLAAPGHSALTEAKSRAAEWHEGFEVELRHDYLLLCLHSPHSTFSAVETFVPLYHRDQIVTLARLWSAAESVRHLLASDASAIGDLA